MTKIQISTSAQRNVSIGRALRSIAVASMFGVGIYAAWSGATHMQQKSRMERQRQGVIQALEEKRLDEAKELLARYEADRTLSPETIVSLRGMYGNALQREKEADERGQMVMDLCQAYGTNDTDAIARLVGQIQLSQMMGKAEIGQVERRCHKPSEAERLEALAESVGEKRIADIERFMREYPDSKHTKELLDDAASAYLSVGRSYFKGAVAPKETLGHLVKFHRFLVTHHPRVPTGEMSEYQALGTQYAQSHVPDETPGIVGQDPGPRKPRLGVHSKTPDMDLDTYNRWQQARKAREQVETPMPESITPPVHTPSLRAEFLQHLEAIERASYARR